jgi:hypothetical protein
MNGISDYNWLIGCYVIIKFLSDVLQNQATDQLVSWFNEGMCSIYFSGWHNRSDDGTYSKELFGFSGKAGLWK